MAEPRTILYIHHGSGAGGAANSLLYLLADLDRERFRPVVSCNFEAPEAREFFASHGFAPVHLPLAPIAHTSKSWDLRTPRGLAKLAQWLLLKQGKSRKAIRNLVLELRPDLVHLNGVSLLPFAGAVRGLGVPVVQHIRESVNDGTFGIRKRWLRRLARRHASYLVYICEDGKQHFPPPAGAHSVVYDPVPLAKFAPDNGHVYRRELGISDEARVLFFPGGSMLDIKGIIPFLHSLAIARHSHPDVRAIVPGIDRPPHPRDTTRAQIESIIAAHRLEPAIVRAPFTEQVERYYLASDIVVAPFIMPHFSRAVIEAGATAKPVVGSRIGGIMEVLRDNETGLLAGPGDHRDLADKLCVLIEDTKRARALGQTGLNYARANFSAAAHATSIMRIYDEVLETADAAT